MHKNLHQVRFCNKIKVGDIAIIKNPARKRQHWKIGRVLELIPGSDGNVRAVKLFRGDEHYRTNPQIVIHAIDHLYPLELSLTHNHVTAADSLSIDLDNIIVFERY